MLHNRFDNSFVHNIFEDKSRIEIIILCRREYLDFIPFIFLSIDVFSRQYLRAGFQFLFFFRLRSRAFCNTMLNQINYHDGDDIISVWNAPTSDPSSVFPLTKLVETCFFFSFTTFLALSKLYETKQLNKTLRCNRVRHKRAFTFLWKFAAALDSRRL